VNKSLNYSKNLSKKTKNDISSKIDVSMLHAGEAAINFEELLKDYRKRNETTLPYTIQ
jgi:hypothetical protein